MSDQPYTLSANCQRQIRSATHDDGQHDAVAKIVMAEVERARKVKPLVWVRSAYAWQEAYPFSGHRYTIFDRDFATWICRFQGEVFANCKTEDEAKAACEAHHEQFILSNLEDV